MVEEDLMQPVEEDIKPKPVYQPPQSYQSSGNSWAVLDAVGEGLEALVDIFDIFD